jgi:transcription-repair coupling factor (superfamily II helicase)
MFGLSDLHQMRGRVGRSNRKAFCYLLTPAVSAMTTDARKRLSTLEEFSELGDGFKVAMRDLDIRGAGNLLGAEQSGFISDLGFEMYHDILDKAVQELKESEFRDLFVKELPVKELITDCVIETDLQLLIPEQYVSSISERLSLYSQLDNIKDEAGLQKFQQSVQDRFGPMPGEVKDLIETVRLRWIAEKIGLEKLIIKNDNMKGYFTSSDNEAYFKSDKFSHVLQYLQKNPKKSRLKEVKNKLIIIFDNISSVEKAKQALDSVSG